MPRAATSRTRSDYFDAALALLSTGTHEDITVAVLCDALGVSKGSFYYHFTNVPEFDEALLEHWATVTSVEATATLTHLTNKRDVLAKMVELIPHDAEAAIRLWAITAPSVHDAQERVDQERIEALAGILASHMPRRDAVALAELHYSVVVQAQMAGRPVDRRQLGRLLKSLSVLIETRYGPAVYDG